MGALMERLGFGGRELTSSGHGKDFVLKVVQPSRFLSSSQTGTTWVMGTSLAGYRFLVDVPKLDRKWSIARRIVEDK